MVAVACPICQPDPEAVTEHQAVALEFWARGESEHVAPRMVKRLPVNESGLNARELLIRHRDRAPRQDWYAVVARYACGCAHQSKLMGDLRGEFTPQAIRACFSASLTYSDPNFNSDVSFNVADAIAVKGGAPDADDKFWTYNDATFTVEQNVACLYIRAGETSAGAAPAGQRVGHLTLNAGVTVTMTGGPNNNDSRILSYPASAAAESKNCTLTVLGTLASPVTITNSTGAYDTTHRYWIAWEYGFAYIDYLVVKYASMAGGTGGRPSLDLPGSSAYSNATITDLGQIKIVSGNSGTAHISAIMPSGGGVGVPILWRDLIIDCSENVSGTASVSPFINNSQVPPPACGRTTIIAPTGFAAIVYLAVDYIASAGTRYWAGTRSSTTDIRPTITVPAGLALANPSPTADGELVVTWTNAASYASGDKVVVYNAADDSVLGILDATAGTGRISGLAIGDPYTVYAKATSDNYVFSAATANVGPTTCTGTDTPEVANVRTTDTVRGTPGACTVPAAGELKAGVQVGAGGTEVTGARTDADPDAVLDSEPTFGDPGAPLVPAFDLAADRLAFEAARNSLADVTKIPTPATGGPAPWGQFNVSRVGTLDLDAAKLAFESGRNTVPELSEIPTPATGGPDPWTQLGVARAGTQDMDAVKLAFEAARNTALAMSNVLKDVPVRQFGADDLGEFDEAARNTDPGVANVRETVLYKIRNVDKVGTYEDDPPGAPSWATVARTPGDGKVTLHVVAAAAGDVLYARSRRLAPGTAWSAESETLKRTGTGDIEVPGTNGTAYQYAVYAKMGDLPSYWTRPVEAIPTDGSRAQIDLIMEAVAGEVNLLALQSKDTDGDAVDVAATVELPPLFDSVDTPCVKVFPDTEEGEPLRGSRNEIVYRVNVAFCQRSKTAAQKQEQFRTRQTLRDHFLGRRLSALPGVLCTDEAESGVLDMELLWERFQWVSVITLEFVSSRDKG